MSPRRSRRSRRGLRLRDRFFTAGVARAITSPAGIVAGSTAAAVFLGGGAHPAMSILAGVAAWAVPVARAMQRVPGMSSATGRAKKGRKGSEERVGPEWQAAVVDAEAAVDRFQQSIEDCRTGPLRDRLIELEEDVLQSLDTCRDLAAWGAEVEEARRELNPAAMERVARRSGKAAADAATTQRQLVAELLQIEDEARVRLALINGRLDEAVARGVEIVGHAFGLGGRVRGDGDDAARVAAQLTALSAALHEVDQHEHPHQLAERTLGSARSEGDAGAPPKRKKKAKPRSGGTTATG